MTIEAASAHTPIIHSNPERARRRHGSPVFQASPTAPRDSGRAFTGPVGTPASGHPRLSAGCDLTAPDGYSCKRALEKAEQVCGKALRAFHAERKRWAEWERQCAEANARLMPGSGGDLAHAWREKGIEEVGKLMEQRLQEPRRLLTNPDVNSFEGREYLAEEGVWTHSMLGGIEVHVSPMAVHLAPSIDTCSGSLGRRSFIRKRRGPPSRWSSRNGNGLASSFARIHRHRGCEWWSMSLFTSCSI